jgi:hypothetical protein
MKKLFAITIALTLSFFSFAQNPGDTIVVQAFDWSMTYGNAWDGVPRDTTVTFPDNQTLTFEKVIMLYNIRCRDGNVNTTGGNSNGCGEWDYSCNTYIHDSAHVDSTLSSHVSHSISNFSNTTFYYSNSALYNYIRTIQQSVVVNSTTTETSSTVGAGSVSIPNTFPTDKLSSKAQYLYTEAELTGAGFAAGTIDAIGLNILTGTSDANFLRVLIKHTTATALDPENPELTGFDTVYYHNTSFSPGAHKIQFHQPFTWDGTSNIIVEFSFTNTVAGTAVTVEGTNAADSAALYNNDDSYISVSGAEYMDISTTNLTTISNEITVSFWSNGNANVLPVNTSILEGTDANNNRTINIHHPWSNGRVYWDCGGNGSGGHDRIDKLATAAEYEGNWNHWAFTKNAVSGEMKIFLNGVLWHSGTGQTNTIDIQTLKLAANKNSGNNWAGYIDEFRIFDAELAQTEIQDWMNKRIDNNHPNYANLVAYYPFNEGSGTMANDISTGAQATNFVGNVEWNTNRGDKINRFFNVNNERPNMEFFQGTYSLTVTNDTIYDSIQHPTHNVIEYAVVPKYGTMEDDSIATVSDTNYTQNQPSKTFDENGVTLSVSPNSNDGSIAISSLPYYRRYPMRFEILSLVTPYGVNLDMGPDGETWAVDLTDFMPIMTGDKRITVNRGGQWQEDMDIKFLFIVGTPPRDVLDVQQIWRNDSKGYQTIMSDGAFEPRDVVLDPNGVSFKIRSSITGHGQEGEFIPQTHYLDVDGGNREYSWQVWTECSENPIYPQGGTWIYDRAGWCPGMPTDLEQVDITSFVTPGQTHSLDYGVTNATGTSNYIVNNQLVTYGAANFTLDAAIVDVIQPSNYIEYRRDNPICANPQVRIRNTGSTTLTSLTIEYWVNDDQNHQTYEWTGSLEFMEEAIVDLPAPQAMWDGIAGMAMSKFHTTISLPNNGADEYAHNNSTYSEFEIPEVLPSNFYIYFKSNNAPLETKYEVFDANGNVVFTRDNMIANTFYRDTLSLTWGCYQFRITDTGDDGISFWANNDGSGFCQLREVGGPTIKYLQPDFGGVLIYNFTIDFPLSYEEYKMNQGISLYPNPASTEFTVTGKKIEEGSISIFNSMGQKIELNAQLGQDEVSFNTGNLPPGIYLVKIILKGREYTERLIVK